MLLVILIIINMINIIYHINYIILIIFNIFHISTMEPSLVPPVRACTHPACLTARSLDPNPSSPIPSPLFAYCHDGPKFGATG